MSEALREIEKFRMNKLTELYHECTEAQQNFFCRLYGSLEDIPKDKIDMAIQQCERTIIKNEARAKK